MLDLERLATLLAVVEEGSLSAAARRLHLTQSAVSQQIASLEHAAGQPLLHRRPVRPTEACRTLITHAERLLALARIAEDDLAAYAQLKSGTLRVAAFASACTSIIPAAAARFHHDHPAIRLTLHRLETAPAIHALLRGEIDLAVCFDYAGRATTTSDPLQRISLFSEPIDIALPASHPLAAQAELALRDLANAPWIEAPNAGIALHELSRLAITPQPSAHLTYHGDDFPTVLSLVAAGNGIAILPRLAASNPPPGVALRPLTSPPLDRDVFVCLPGTARQPAAVAAFLQHLRGSAGSC